MVTVPSPFPSNFRRAPVPVTTDTSIDARTFVVVGGGAAGAVAVQTLRQSGFRGHIKLLTAEAYLPYDRVLISKSLKPEPALLRDAAYYAANGIEVRGVWLTRKPRNVVSCRVVSCRVGACRVV